MTTEPATAHRHIMPGFIHLRLDERLTAHLDQQATERGMTRPAYIRGLIVDDIKRQGPAGRTALAPRTGTEPTAAA